MTIRSVQYNVQVVCTRDGLCAGHLVRLHDDEPCSLTTDADIEIARTEQARESTGGRIMVDHRTNPPTVHDGCYVLARGHKFVGVDVEPNHATVARNRLQDQESTKQKLANCEYCLGTGRAGRFVDELMGAKGGPCTVCNGRGAI